MSATRRRVLADAAVSSLRAAQAKPEKPEKPCAKVEKEIMIACVTAVANADTTLRAHVDKWGAHLVAESMHDATVAYFEDKKRTSTQAGFTDVIDLDDSTKDVDSVLGEESSSDTSSEGSVRVDQGSLQNMILNNDRLLAGGYGNIIDTPSSKKNVRLIDQINSSPAGTPKSAIKKPTTTGNNNKKTPAGKVSKPRAKGRPGNRSGKA